MKNDTRLLARSALLAALAAALMYVSAVIPSGRAAVIAIAGLMSCAAVISCGTGWAWGVFAVTAVLSLLVLPLKGCAVIYAAFLGWYPIAKSLIERRIRSSAAQWAIKLVLFNAAMTALLILAKWALLDGGFPENIHGWMIAAAYVVLNAVFFIYDVLMTRLIPVYIDRVANKIFKQGGQRK